MEELTAAASTVQTFCQPQASSFRGPVTQALARDETVVTKMVREQRAVSLEWIRLQWTRDLSNKQD
ncbi:MAG: hypothetical protein R3E34_04020 [Rhodocyclaceae bacterium]